MPPPLGEEKQGEAFATGGTAGREGGAKRRVSGIPIARSAFILWAAQEGNRSWFGIDRTHKTNGLSRNDFILAAKIDAV